MIKTLQGFRDFIMRGNVVDLAVGIVVGASFTGLVSSFTDSFIEPIIKIFGGGRPEMAGVWRVAGQDITWAAFANSLITFAITAAVLYFLVVLPMNRLSDRLRREESKPAVKSTVSSEPSEEVLLLREIRDALQHAGQPHPATMIISAHDAERQARR